MRPRRRRTTLNTEVPPGVRYRIIVDFIESLQSSGMSTRAGSFSCALLAHARNHVWGVQRLPRRWSHPLMPTSGAIDEYNQRYIPEADLDLI